MQLFLYISIVKTQPLLNLNKSLVGKLPGVSFYDLDNHSEPVVVDTAVRAIEEASAVFVHLETEDENPGVILKVMKRLAKFEKSHDLIVVHNGINSFLERMEKSFDIPWFKNQNEHVIRE
ncbi:hypothetical protein E1176_11310, partial [Fulvivirga sp. RKSG066]|uniref:hypothetical protein n=1 Tax=Fulvivirga aurantia TaxID=2529383 RepID=UPI0012BC7EFA